MKRTLARVLSLVLLCCVPATASQPYTYRILATNGTSAGTPGYSIVSFKSGPSINDNRKVAFLAQTSTGSKAVFVAEATGSGVTLTKLTETTAGDYGSVSLNNLNQLAVSFRATASGVTTANIRRYTLVPPGLPTIAQIAQATTARQTVTIDPCLPFGSSCPFTQRWRVEGFDNILDAVSMNDSGMVTYIGQAFSDLGQATYYLTRQSQYVQERDPLGVLPQQVFGDRPDFDPAIAGTGEIVARVGGQTDSPIVLYSAALDSPITIAGEPSFTRIGRSPGISDSGKFIAFYGELATGGRGIFISIASGGSRFVQQVTDVSQGSDSFTPDARVAIASDDCGLYAATVVYKATRGGMAGIFRNNLIRQASTGVETFIATPATAVFQAGSPIKDAVTGAVLDGTTTDLDLREAVNKSGDVAFWIKIQLAAGSVSEGIVYANAPQLGYHQGAGEVMPLEKGVPEFFGYPYGFDSPIVGKCVDTKPNGTFRSRTRCYGCALCSTASMLQSLGYGIDPSSLDSLLVKQRTATEGGNGYGGRDLMNWYGIARVFEQLKFLGKSDLGAQSFDDFFDSEFCTKGNRIIIELTHQGDGRDGESHFVLLVARNGTDWTVFDPGARAPCVNKDDLSSLRVHRIGFTDCVGTFRRYEVAGARVFALDATLGAIQTALAFRANSPVEMVVTDLQGRRLGSGAGGSSDFFEIPEGSYFRDFAVSAYEGGADPSGDPSGVKTAYIRTPIVGPYEVAVTGTAAGNYRLDFVVMGAGGASKATTVTGTTDVGVVSNYSVVFPVIGTADLVVSQLAETNVVNVGSNVTYTIGIVNLGPSNATAVSLVDTLPQYANFVAAGASQGTVTQAYGVVRCDIGDLPMGGAATVAVTLTPTAARPLTNIVTLMGFEADPNPTNNTATIIVSVLGTNPPPIAVNDSATTTNGMPVTINVLANDVSTNGVLDPTTVTVTTSPTNGTTSVDAYTGAITYTPNAGFVGTNVDSFRYTAQDDLGTLSNEGVVSVVVIGQPEGATPVSPSYVVEQITWGTQPCRYPRLNNNGEVVWQQMTADSLWQVVSGDRGQLTQTNAQYTDATSPAIADDGSYVCYRHQPANGYGCCVFYAGPWSSTCGHDGAGWFPGYTAIGANVSLSSDGKAIFYYEHQNDGSSAPPPVRWLLVDGRGNVSNASWASGDWPDLSSLGNFVYGESGQIYLNNQLLTSGNYPNINDAPLDKNEVVFVRGTNLMSSRVGELKDYRGHTLWGNWVDINRQGTLVFERTTNGISQVFKAYVSAPQIVSIPGTNGLVGLPYRYDSDNRAEAYGDESRPLDPHTTVYWSLVSGPAGFTIESDTGHIQWIPQAPGTYTATIAATFMYWDGTEFEDTQTFSIYVEQAAVEIVDAVDFRQTRSPELLVDANQYWGGGSGRVGAQADGASRLVLRVPLWGAETNSFPYLHFAIAGTNGSRDGRLGAIGSSTWAGDIPATIACAGGTNKAVCLYEAPTDYELAMPQPRIELLNGTNVIATRAFPLRRPPVVLIHEPWGQPGDWALVQDRLLEAGLDVWLADYSTFAAGIDATNLARIAPLMFQPIADAVAATRQAGFAASRVDLIGHGAGGVLARLYSQQHRLQAENYWLGSVHKLITIGTPHLGSYIADAAAFARTNDPVGFSAARSLVLAASEARGNPIPLDLAAPAFADQATGSPVLSSLTDLPVPSHAVGAAGQIRPPGDILALIEEILGVATGEANDGFVTLASAVGGIDPGAVTVLTNIPHAFQLADTNVAALLTSLLQEPIGGANRFGYFPAVAWGGSTNPPVIPTMASFGSWLVLSGLTNNQSVTAGLSYQVRAQASDARPVARVQFFSPISTVLDPVAPFDYSFTVPTNGAGSVKVLAVATDAMGAVASASVALVVTNSASLQLIEVEPTNVVLRSTVPFALRVWGQYSDGFRRDLTARSAGTRYGTSDRNVVGVNTNGLLFAKLNSGGSPVIISITNGALMTNVNVAVVLDNLPPVAAIVASPTTGPAPMDVVFNGLSSLRAQTYSWDFGDGTSDTVATPPAHRFLVPGDHVVTLTVTGPFGVVGIDRRVVTVEPWFVMKDPSLTLTQRLSFNQVIVTNGGSLTAPAGLDCGDIILMGSALNLGTNSTASSALVSNSRFLVTNGVVMTGSVLLAATNYVHGTGNLGSLSVNGTNTFEGSFSAASLFVSSNSVLTTVPEVALDLTVSGQVQVAQGAMIDVRGKGYQGGLGLGRGPGGGEVLGGGGGYGGMGGRRVGSAASQTYGFLENPADFGSAGGGWSCCGGDNSAGGSGGGLVRLLAQQLVLDGVINADGESRWPVSGIQPNAQAGAGGGIRLEIGTFSGAGAISAAGGTNSSSDDQLGIRSYAGGGGRVAVYYADMSGFSGRISAQGGLGRGTEEHNGGAGTVFLKKASEAYGELIIDNGGMDTIGWSTPLVTTGAVSLARLALLGNTRVLWTNSPLSVTDSTVMVGSNWLQVASGSALGNAALSGSNVNVTVVGNAGFGALVISSGAMLTLNGSNSAASLFVSSNSVLTTVPEVALDLTVSGQVQVAQGAMIDVRGKGYQGGLGLGRGPGGGEVLGGGGGYGGMGGRRVGSAASQTYGFLENPADFGSAGGGWSCCGGDNSAGGSGGGLVRLLAQQLVLDGVINADGESRWPVSGIQPNAQAGAGGGIRLEIGTFSGAGAISAAGGTNSSSDDQLGIRSYAGGGGRVAVYYADMSGFSGRISAQGGLGRGTEEHNGGAGTVFLKKASEAYGELIIDNGGMDTIGWSTPLLIDQVTSLDALTISGAARVSATNWVRVTTGDPALFSDLIRSNYFQVGSLWVAGQWVYGDIMELEAGMAGGSPRISFFTKPNQPYVIEVSTNLSLWTPILTNASTNGVFEWIETNTVQRRFFRSRQ